MDLEAQGTLGTVVDRQTPELVEPGKRTARDGLRESIEGGVLDDAVGSRTKTQDQAAGFAVEPGLAALFLYLPRRLHCRFRLDHGLRDALGFRHFRHGKLDAFHALQGPLGPRLRPALLRRDLRSGGVVPAPPMTEKEVENGDAGQSADQEEQLLHGAILGSRPSIPMGYRGPHPSRS